MSKGPSGPNKVISNVEHAFAPLSDGIRFQDYLYELAAAVKELAPESYDSHLTTLEVRGQTHVLASRHSH